MLLWCISRMVIKRYSYDALPTISLQWRTRCFAMAVEGGRDRRRGRAGRPARGARTHRALSTSGRSEPWDAAECAGEVPAMHWPDHTRPVHTVPSTTPPFLHNTHTTFHSTTRVVPLFGLISRIPGLHYGFFLCFSFFLVFSYRYFLPFKFFRPRSLISPITVCFLIFIFYFFFSSI